MFGNSKRLEAEIASLRATLAVKEQELVLAQESHQRISDEVSNGASENVLRENYDKGLFQRFLSFSQSMADCQTSMGGLAAAMKKEAEIIDQTADAATLNATSVHRVNEKVQVMSSRSQEISKTVDDLNLRASQIGGISRTDKGHC